MRRTLPYHLRTRPVAALLVAGALVVTLTACDDGGDPKPGSAGSTNTSKPRKHRGSTTTSAPKGTSSTTSSTTLPATTVPPTPTTTLPPTSGGTCGAATGPITAAVLGGDLGQVPVASYDVTDCRRAGSQPIWAAVTLRPKPGQSVPQLNVVLELFGSIWTVHSYASGPTGCDAPPPVPAELRTGC